MPKEEIAIAVDNSDKETLLAIVYTSFKKLNWEILFAGEERIMAHTPRNWKTYGEEIIAGATDTGLSISSELHESASFDLMKKNKKNLAAFSTAFEVQQRSVTEDEIKKAATEINLLREKTTKAAEQEIQSAEEIDKVMNLSKGNLDLTYALIAANVLMFVLTIVSGSGIMETNNEVIVKWGANFPPLTLNGDWWRLFTSTFLHFGVIHLLMNMYALYMAGVYLEPMLGKLRYITAYVCTGIAASVVSVWWHVLQGNADSSIMAGASGAVFGLYGVFLALLFTNIIPKQLRQSLLQSIGIFVVYNLIYGVKGGVDNAAHIGGLLSGLVIGFIYYLTLKRPDKFKVQIVCLVIVVITAAASFQYLNKPTDPNIEFSNSLDKFGEQEKKALAPLQKGTVYDGFKQDVAAQSLPAWDSAKIIFDKIDIEKLSATNKQKAILFKEYIRLRAAESQYLILDSVNTAELDHVQNDLKIVVDKIEAGNK